MTDTALGEIRRLLARIRSGALDAAYDVRQYDTARINELLRPAIKASSVAGLPKWTGGIAGAPGEAAGRACFSSAALLEAKKQARRRGIQAEDDRYVLVLPSVFAGDVPALEAAEGALTVQGGYGSHASVVARQHGKVSLVAPPLGIDGKTATLGNLRFSEGDCITLDAGPAESAVYLGAAELARPDACQEELREFIALARGFVKKIRILANADTPEEAERALSFGADGIGLCRTEHMFFQQDRINSFRALILSESRAEREGALEKLAAMQREDFCRIFRIMAGKPVVVRLLDAPLNEFMPRGAGEIEEYLDYCARQTGMLQSAEALAARIATLRESNPMLGRRGCRIAVSYPEIYAMQVRAVGEAARQLRDGGVEVLPELLIPLVMNAAEFRLIAYGKRTEGAGYAGIADVAEAFLGGTAGAMPPCRIGAMIELPAAALGAGDIAGYAQFFSFGANDLTQTALGLSRDDAAAFLDGYAHYDILGRNPFIALDARVKELIALAVERGRVIRPDLGCGLCGGQAADPETIRFCLETGLDYLSCSPYDLPAAIVTAAQAELSTVCAGTRT